LQNFYEISLFSQNSWISLRSDFFFGKRNTKPWICVCEGSMMWSLYWENTEAS
jgi:hypothetical protein